MPKAPAPVQFKDAYRSLCLMRLLCRHCDTPRLCAAITKRRRYGWRTFECPHCGRTFNQRV